MKKEKLRREAWFGVVFCEGESKPKGADLPMRDAVRKAASELGLKVIKISSGWGMSEEDAEKLIAYQIKVNLGGKVHGQEKI